MKKLPMIALIAGVVAWVMTRGKKQESPEGTLVGVAGSDTSPSEG